MAKLGHTQAIHDLFTQFLPRGEQPKRVGYFGVLGFRGIGIHYFAALTERRLATIELAILDGITYAEAPLESIVGSDIVLLSRIRRYLSYVAEISIGLVLGALVVRLVPEPYAVPVGLIWVVVLLVILPVTNRVFYRFTRSRVYFRVRDAGVVYFRVDDSHRDDVAGFYRDVMSSCRTREAPTPAARRDDVRE